jgi:glycosyltransferase involved in cell wall biosynthesis
LFNPLRLSSAATSRGIKADPPNPLVHSEPPRFSIVIPVRNEGESVTALVAAIETALAPMSGRHEVVFIDDGSTDDTLDQLKRLAREHRHIRVYSFRRNFGKSLALECGFRMATGEFILTMDGDLQDDPGDLQQMHDHLTKQDVDIVSGWRRNRRDTPLKIALSKAFNLVVVRMLFRASFKDMNSGLKLYKAEVARELHLYGGMYRFIPLIAAEMGFKVAEVPVTHHERRYGTSKYRATKVVTQIPDLLTMFFLLRFTRRPLHFFGRVGSAFFALGLACLVYLTVLWTRGVPIGTRPLLAFGVLLILIGGQVVFTGLLADLIVNMAQDRKQQLPLRYASDAEARSRGVPALAVRDESGALEQPEQPGVAPGVGERVRDAAN